MAAWLWVELHELFESDDGSLPEIRVNYADPQAATRGYEFLCKRSGKPAPEVSPAMLASGAFHVVLAGVQSRGLTLPDLGVFVFPDQLVLDYRMWRAWGPANVEALFALLERLTALDPHAWLSLEDAVDPQAVARFHSAWRRYLEEHAA